ncbi:MAG: pyridoxal-phosphate dependent enzyme [Gammaproteobacteria bacterium]|nr:pyridoxal-phosphate dependent enzyme [Gammaproteobacteria bacterium]
MHDLNFPRVSLGFFPTPLIELANLGAALGGARILMKRDDQTGLALGGNKTRKLEYILGDALAQGCDTIITAGAEQSNHCRQTAAAAAKLKLECHLILGGTEPASARGNLLLDRLLGCHIHWAGDHRKGEDIPQLFEQLQSAGKHPYIVPYGGSNELGAIAFAAATRELLAQSGDEPFTHLVFASSSGGTHAGLMLGKFICDQAYRLIGVNIDKGEADDPAFDQHILSLANRTAALLEIEHRFSNEDLILNSDYLGAGYGVVGALEREAISLTARTEGILLDPVYTGRAMGGLIDMIRKGAIGDNDKILFWHTGGAPALFAYASELIPEDRGEH